MAVLVDRAVSSPYSWAYLSMIDLLAGFSAELMGWCEGCSCPAHQYIYEMEQSSYHSRRAQMGDNACQFKGRRAPDLAAGALQERIDFLNAAAVSKLSAMAANLAMPDQTKLFEDWNSGCAARLHTAVDGSV